MIGSTLPLMTSLTQYGASPSPATAAIRQITARRSSHVASVSFRCSGFLQVPYRIFPTTRRMYTAVMTILIVAMMVQVRWKRSVCWNEPTKTVISAINPLKPGKPRLARPAIT